MPREPDFLTGFHIYSGLSSIFCFQICRRITRQGEYISTNCVANILGLGWAATPAGLKAMTELSKLEEERRHEEAARPEDERRREAASQPEAKMRRRAGGHTRICGCPGPSRLRSREQPVMKCVRFLILNISSLQLIPVSIIAYRSQYGSADPTAIVGPAIVATAVSTAVAVVYCKLKDRRKEYKNPACLEICL